MSANKVVMDAADDEEEVCASCGIAAVDDITLKNCACNLVKYCTVDCQKNDRSRHKKACKKKMAELRDRDLFTQPDSSYLGECPICFLPLSLDILKSTMMSCCCKLICMGCDYANTRREIEQGLEHRCAFCREPVPKPHEKHEKRLMERIKKNDPVAMVQMGKTLLLEEGDHEKAAEYFTKAAELGDVDAHFCLGLMHGDGNGVEKDTKKAVYHWEQAAIGGHHGARGNLAFHEKNNGRLERAAKHWIIAANLGCDTSLKIIKDLFVDGIVSKDDYAAALRGYQSAVNETKSSEREEGEEFYATHRTRLAR